ncbi:hypothetical protein [Nocardioides panaciterrulae]|uniref:Uncharacterized protein n=1 Tax=Nocardioides panaciterrulae TaxID=661492 RepID=A0A7Y9E3S6_9ACTN|nr:hypothetical protein [Nocardioides panaciterrulae]NYD40497.1 hypothetical protein [Nocardioides panaciterrulae]
MLAGLVLAGLVVLAAVAPQTGRIGAIALGLTSVVWLLVDQSVEGVVVLTVTRTHGLTSSDLAGIAGLGVAGWLFFWPRD